MSSPLAAQLDVVDSAMPFRVVGKVHGISGLTLEAVDLPVPVGAVCRITSFGGQASMAEVIGFREDRTLLMPLSSVAGVSRGDAVEIVSTTPRVACSDQLLGRVLNGFGLPTDGGGALPIVDSRRIDARGVHPLARQNIHEPISTSIRSIDGLHTCGMGQRMGIFAGPGVGKSTLMSSIAKHTSADVSVIALIGERGREVQEFIAKSLGPDGMARCVLVVSTGDDPAPLIVRAAKVAATIAEYFRDQGKNVLLLMDSLTRLCQAQRRIGLAAGEPPITKGLPPSVFALLPEILERAGKTEGGSITGFYTVLVEGDDFNEPIPDAVKGITDGHLWLDRRLATQGHFPAVDVLQSISRVRGDVCDGDQVRCALRVLSLVDTYEQIKDLVNIGAYVPGANLEYDLAVQARPRILQFLRQSPKEPGTLETTKRQLMDLATWIDQMDRALKAQAAKAAKAPGRGAA